MISDPLISTLFPSIISDGHSAAMFLLCWAFHYRAEAGPAIAPWDREQTFTSTAATAGSGASDTSTTHQKAACSTPDTPPAAEPAELPPPGPLSSDNHLLLPPRFYGGRGKGKTQQQQEKQQQQQASGSCMDPGRASAAATGQPTVDSGSSQVVDSDSSLVVDSGSSQAAGRMSCLQLHVVGGGCCLREVFSVSRVLMKEAQLYPGLLKLSGRSVQVVHIPAPQVLQLKVRVGRMRCYL